MTGPTTSRCSRSRSTRRSSRLQVAAVTLSAAVLAAHSSTSGSGSRSGDCSAVSAVSAVSTVAAFSGPQSPLRPASVRSHGHGVRQAVRISERIPPRTDSGTGIVDVSGWYPRSLSSRATGRQPEQLILAASSSSSSSAPPDEDGGGDNDSSEGKADAEAEADADAEAFAERLLSRHDEVRRLIEQEEQQQQQQQQDEDRIDLSRLEDATSSSGDASAGGKESGSVLYADGGSSSGSDYDDDAVADLGDAITPTSLDHIEAIADLASKSMPMSMWDNSSPINSEKQAQSIANVRDMTMRQPTADRNGTNTIDSMDSGARTKKEKKRQRRRRRTTKAAAEISKSIPTYRSLMTFVTTTVLIWLSEPLLSLIDTTVVGRFGGAAQAGGGASAAAVSTTATATAVTRSKLFLSSIFTHMGLFNEAAKPDLAISQSVLNLASLGPAVLLIDNCIYVTYFLSIATTNRLAKHLAEKDAEGTVKTVSHVLGVAVVLGLAFTAFVWLGGEAVLNGIVGDSAAAVAGGVGEGGIAPGRNKATRAATAAATAAAAKAQVVGSALTYAKIRSSIGILTILDITSQAICLAARDLRTPVLAVIFASLTNIVGDYLLVVKFGMGIRGAAIATAAANVVSCSVLLSAVFGKFGRWRKVAAREREDRQWREGRMNIAGLNGSSTMMDGDQTNSRRGNDNKEEPILPDGLGVAGSKAKRKADQRLADDQKNKELDQFQFPKKAAAASKNIPLSKKEKVVIAMDKLSRGLTATSTLAVELAAAFNPRAGAMSWLTDIADSRVVQRAKASLHKAKRKVVGNKNDLPPFISLPHKKELLSLFSLAGPIFLIILLKVCCYSAMTLRASSFGMLALASHNVLLRLFFFYTTFGDALSQCAQTFLPEVLYGDRTTKRRSSTGEEQGTEDVPTISEGERRERIKATLGRMIILSAVAAVMNGILSNWIATNCGGYFTSDDAVCNLMAGNSRYMALSIFLHPFIMLCEGVIMSSGQSGFGYLVKSYSATIVLLWSMLRLPTSFDGVWLVWFGFQVARLVQFGARVWSKTVRGTGEGDGGEDAVAAALDPA